MTMANAFHVVCAWYRIVYLLSLFYRANSLANSVPY